LIISPVVEFFYGWGHFLQKDSTSDFPHHRCCIFEKEKRERKERIRKFEVEASVVLTFDMDIIPGKYDRDIVFLWTICEFGKQTVNSCWMARKRTDAHLTLFLFA